MKIKLLIFSMLLGLTASAQFTNFNPYGVQWKISGLDTTLRLVGSTSGKYIYPLTKVGADKLYNLTFGNGLTKTGNSISLGGRVTSPFLIGDLSDQAVIYHDQNSVTIYAKNSDELGNSLVISPTLAALVYGNSAGINITSSGLSISDDVDLRGAFYSAKYRSGLTNRWLTDKEYVDSATVANTLNFSNGLTKTGDTVKLGGALSDGSFVGIGELSKSYINILTPGGGFGGAVNLGSAFNDESTDIQFSSDRMILRKQNSGLFTQSINFDVEGDKMTVNDNINNKGLGGGSPFYNNYNPNTDSLLYAQYGGVKKLIDSSHVFNGMRIAGGSTDAFPKSDHLVIKADTVDRPTRMHIEPSGFINNGLATKLDFMMDPFDNGLASYRLLNAFTRVGNFAGLNGENGLGFIGMKSTGEHVPQYPGLHFGFNDDAADAVPMKMYYFESTAGIDWLKPMRGLWREGMPITANDYINVGLRLYKATGTGTTGTIKPVHTSGTVSDGSINFEYIRSVVLGSMRPTVFFGDRDLMPLHGLPDTRAQFAKNATFWQNAKLEFGSSTNVRHYDIGTNTGSEDLVIGNIVNSQKITMKSAGGIEANTTVTATQLTAGVAPSTYAVDASGSSSSLARLTNTAAVGSAAGAAIRLQTAATPSSSNNRLGSIAYGAGTETNSAAMINAYADGAHTANSSQSSRISFFTTNPGASNATEKVTIGSSGLLNIASLTASNIVVTDASKNLVSSTIPTILGYTPANVDEVTKAVDTVSSAPTPTSTGVKNSVIITGGYRYECIATNTWVRSVVETTW